MAFIFQLECLKRILSRGHKICVFLIFKRVGKKGSEIGLIRKHLENVLKGKKCLKRLIKNSLTSRKKALTKALRIYKSLLNKKDIIGGIGRF